MSDLEKSSPIFLTTQWTQVLAARGDSERSADALRDLCAVYYEPVLAFLRRARGDDDAARDAAHAFFEWMLSRDSLAGLERGRGRFRSYLLGALKHFLARRHEAALRGKRGGRAPHVSLDETGVLPPADESALPPDREFDRQWALHVLRRALAAVENEAGLRGSGVDFASMAPFLTGEATHGAMASLAAQRGLSEATLRSQVHRLRQHFRQCVRAEISPTVAESPRSTGKCGRSSKR